MASAHYYSHARLLCQRILGQVIFFPCYYIFTAIWKWGFRYRIENHQEIRKETVKILHQTAPLMICSNHLNYCDSMLIHWLLAPSYWYQFNFKKFSWNLPAGDFFGKKWYYRLLGFVGKCLFIHRNASPAHHEHILNLCAQLLASGEPVTIFPEGRRSRSGTFDVGNLTTGVGRVLCQTPACAVLCVYLRSYNQSALAPFPPRNSVFFARTKLIYPKTTLDGKQGVRDLVTQIGETIKAFEHEYFKICQEKPLGKTA